jgi:hypothetical protein
MGAPRGNGWKLIGSCGVDSGQLMVCDPCYIKSEWIPGRKPAERETLVLTNKGKARFPGLKDWSWRLSNKSDYATPQKALGGLSINDVLEQKLVEALPRETTDEFSYRGCCDATRDGGGGALKFKMGHKGAGVCFSSGYGDGCYEVWGKLNNDGRFVEVRVIMEYGRVS